MGKVNKAVRAVAAAILAFALAAGVCCPAAFADEQAGETGANAVSAKADGAEWLKGTDSELLSRDAELPSSFDLRDTGVVGPVRNQMPWGSCWGFASLAASETSILSELGVTQSEHPLVFSPRHLAWFAGTALPDADTMKATPALAPYASQAGEGTTVRSLATNDYGSPFETGGFSFEAACMMASGVGPVPEDEAPYRNNENMAEVSLDKPVGKLAHGQTLDEFLAEHPGDYNAFVEQDEDGNDSIMVHARKAVTRALAKANALLYYATHPAFDDDGRLIAAVDESSPRYDWGLSADQRFSRAYELEEYRELPEPTGGYEGQPYHYNAQATEAIKRELAAGRGVVATVFEDNVQEERGYAYFTNTETWSQYTYDTEGKGAIHGAAHAVCIVGWDDNWGLEKFKSGTVEASDGTQVSCAPPAPGAWIVRNSYGAEGQAFPNDGKSGYRDKNGKHTGYFYLSYYDMSISRPASFDFDASGHVSSYINQYDLMPAPVAYAEKGLGERFANVFTASADQRVHALSVETGQPNMHARLELWRLGKKGSLEDGEPVASVEADLEYAGFHRLSLGGGCVMREGERFAVVGQLTATDDKGKTVYYVPVHRDVNESSIAKYGDTVDSFVTGVVNAGESYLERRGAWADWSTCIAEGKKDGTLVSHYDYDNFPLKAYADAEDPAPKPAPAADDGAQASGDTTSKAGPASDSTGATGTKTVASTGATGTRRASASAAPATGDSVDPRPALFLAAATAAIAVFAVRVAVRARKHE